MLRTNWISVSEFLIAEHKSSMQVLGASIDLDHADGSVECCGVDAFKESIGDESSVICLNAPQTTHVGHTV
jgi:hypothetical protein